MSAADRVLEFPGGTVVKAKPSREALERSLQAWAHVTVMNAQIFRDESNAMNLSALKSSVRVLEQSLAELEAFDLPPVPGCMR